LFAECDAGFVPDHASGHCYIVLPEMQTLQDGENLCQLLHDAESLLFDSDHQVQSLIELIKTGNLISFW
jgi:hypothetical protein